MEEKYGIDNLKKIISYGMDLGDGYVKAREDGKINLKDAPIFLSSLVKLPGALKSAKKVKDEILDLSNQERNDLKTWFQEKYKCPNEKVELLIEKAVSTAIDGYVFVKGAIELAEAIKDLKSGK